MKSINEVNSFRTYASSAARFSVALIRSRCALLRPRLRLPGLCVQISLSTCHCAIADRARQAGSVVHPHLLTKFSRRLGILSPTDGNEIIRRLSQSASHFATPPAIAIFVAPYEIGLVTCVRRFRPIFGRSSAVQANEFR